MAYKKVVQGRMYPFLYNVTMAVGTFKSLKKKLVEEYVHLPKNPDAGQSGGTYPMLLGIHTETRLTGTYQPNKRDDVMLVQYLLKRIYQKGQYCNPPLKSNGAASLKIDGVYGPRTQSAIEHFQIEMRRNGHNIATDGCVDPERGESSTSSISKTGYSISWLNKYFWVLYPELAPNIAVDPECPPELKQAVGGF